MRFRVMSLGLLCFLATGVCAAEKSVREAYVSPQPDSAFAARRDRLLAKLKPGQALRVLFDSLSQTPKPYFYGAIDGFPTGPFDVVLDPLRRESLLLGQTKMNADRTFYDVWASYKPAHIFAPAVALHALRYSIDTSILVNNSLEGKTAVRFHAETGVERALNL